MGTEYLAAIRLLSTGLNFNLMDRDNSGAFNCSTVLIDGAFVLSMGEDSTTVLVTVYKCPADVQFTCTSHRIELSHLKEELKSRSDTFKSQTLGTISEDDPTLTTFGSYSAGRLTIKDFIRCTLREILSSGNHRYLIVGRHNVGKTLLAKALVDEMAAMHLHEATDFVMDMPDEIALQDLPSTYRDKTWEDGTCYLIDKNERAVPENILAYEDMKDVNCSAVITTVLASCRDGGDAISKIKADSFTKLTVATTYAGDGKIKLLAITDIDNAKYWELPVNHLLRYYW